jgi:ribosomal protein L21
VPLQHAELHALRHRYRLLLLIRASWTAATQVSLPRVLMVGSTARTVLGRPYVPSAEVLAVVEEQVRDA